jgi:two-component system NarL family response regulator
LVLADDHETMLEEISSLLMSDFDVVCAVHHGQALIEATQELQPDGVVSDIHMPLMDGIGACECLRRGGYVGAVILLTLHNELVLVERAFRAGASGFVLKVDAADELIPAIYAALAGRNYCSRNVVSS